ncbi:Peroxisome biogenesis factor 10 [Tetrabaena socialis]|uniref:Peroxisome biogenesis factor 10 n=1 Tax=Tetrabaena socialis TaxID=47790 RepID=A0A2J8A0N3_9CHLO|nr:Peroxisome biogenesis factor 10 [Tetrabaena socialis]|eukprot:PNH06080.1 Peroxisome biogenesis factor 10 [Tetrabaena socialis]
MEDGVELVGVRNTRQQPGAGPSAPGYKPAPTASGQQRNAARRRANLEGQEQGAVIDLTASDQQDNSDARAHDDADVTITEVRAVKRARRAAALSPAAGRPGAAGPTSPSTRGRAAAAAQAPPPPPPPPVPESPKGYKCIICHERMETDLATTTCGHMFCFKCILPWVQKSSNCPTCRTKLTKTKIIRIYPPT